MNTPFTPHAALIAAALCCLSMSAAHAASTSQAEHRAAKDRISAAYKADKAACSTLAGNAKDICIEEAQAKEKVALAEQQYAYSSKARDRNKLWVAQAEAAYDVAREKCDDQAGNAKDVCIKEAQAVRDKALADAKMGKDISESRKDAAQEKRDADHAVAVEKCDALSGDAKASCVNAAKVRFGQK
ncbi:MAG TPA: hypothetical protein VFH49_09900 [Aquabacterium sp.]|nr:hypothetical protein [Aquabacterium sp.]